MSSRLTTFFAGALFLASCATNPLGVAKFDHSFPDRALEINEAYFAELNGQILKNILRARDRQPRMYTSLSDLKITPSATRTNSVNATEIGLGNPGGEALNPWITFGGSSMMGNVNTLELTISPKATNGNNNTPIYHAPIPARTFVTYFNNWSKETVDNILVDEIKPIFKDAKLADDIYNDPDGTFKVFVHEEKAYYCLDNAQCPFKTTSAAEPEKVKTKTNLNITNNPNISNAITSNTISNVTQTMIKAKDASGSYSFINLKEFDIKFEPNDTDYTKFNLRAGKIYACNINEGTVKVSKKIYSLYDCKIASPASEFNDNTTLIYVVNHMPKKGKCSKRVKQDKLKEHEKCTKDLRAYPQEKGVYTISLNSIDNMIFRIGESLKQNNETWVSNIVKIDTADTTDTTDTTDTSKAKNYIKTFFSVHDSNSVAATDKNCIKTYAARTVHHGKIYLAGPPEASKNIEATGCYKNDNSATVLTLISEIIKLNEVNAELKGSSFILPR